MPFKPGKGAMHKEWRVTAEDREKALAKRLVTCLEKLNKHAKELKELKVGQSVKVQNQAGNHDKRWARTGTVVEVGPGPRQYAVRMDGSRNVSLRNRKFLRTFNGVADMMADDSIPQQQPGEGEVQVQQTVNQSGADVGRGQVIRDVTTQTQEADGAIVGGDVGDITTQAQEADGAIVGD